MLMAEIHGKIPSALVTMEDLLTSNVFSFLKYTDREVFLKGYLERLGLSVTGEEAQGAEFGLHLVSTGQQAPRSKKGASR